MNEGNISSVPTYCNKNREYSNICTISEYVYRSTPHCVKGLFAVGKRTMVANILRSRNNHRQQNPEN